jgi:solute carrier family 45 protein 1/2/4
MEGDEPSAPLAPGSMSKARMFAISASQLAVQIAYSVVYAVGNPMMARLALPHWSYTLISASDPISGLILQPLIGHMSDVSESRFGRRRPWIIGGSVLMVIFLLLMVFVEDLSETQIVRQVLFIIFFVGFNIALNGMQGPARSILQDLVPEDQRVMANSYGAVLMGFGIFLSNLPGGITGAFNLGWDPTRWVLIVGMILIVVSISASCIAGEETQWVRTADQELQIGNPFAETFSAFKKLPKSVWIVGFVFGAAIMSYNPYQVVGGDYFGLDIFKGDPINDVPLYNEGVGFGMLVTCVSCVVAGVVSMFQDWLTRLFGVRMVLIASSACSIVAFAPVLMTHNRWVLFGFFCIGTINFLVAITACYALAGLLVPPEDTGVTIGALDIFIELGGELALVIFQLGIGSIWPQRAPTIFCASVTALIGLIISCFVIVPASAKVEDELDVSPEPLGEAVGEPTGEAAGESTGEPTPEPLGE